MKPEILRVVEKYFNEDSRAIVIQKGTTLLKQGYFNDRLFYVKSGRLTATVCFKDNSDDASSHFVFSAEQHTFIGVYSFFSKTWRSPVTVTADEDACLYYIDTETAVLDVADYGDLAQQFMPVILDELSTRQMRLIESSHTREMALQAALEAKELAVLGQLSAGIAHELNNALSVITGNSHTLCNATRAHIAQDYLDAWVLGLEKHSTLSHADIREKSKGYAKQYALDRETARRAVPIFETWNPLPKTLPASFLKMIEAYELGAAWHNVLFASQHANNIIKSIKMLARSSTEHSRVHLKSTVDDACILLSYLLNRGIQIQVNVADHLYVQGNATELVQVWVNLIKNAIEAMQQNQVENPTIRIDAYQDETCLQKLIIAIHNNGPIIPAAVQKQLFQLNFTTKNSGKTIGLGLGLSIVRRILDSHRGEIQCHSQAGLTSFYVYLPY